MQLVIPMSGSSRRFKDAGYKEPKPLIEVDGLPIIQHVVDLFPGVDKIIFICNTYDLENTNMREVLANIDPRAIVVEIEPHKKGPVWAVLQASRWIEDDEAVIVSYCDYGTRWNYTEFLRAMKGFTGGIACYRGFHPHMLGSDNYAFCREENGILLEIKEKEPFTKDRMSEYASNGTYFFSSGYMVKKYFSELIQKDINLNGEYYVSLVYNLMVRDGHKIKLFEIENMLQWGTPHDLETYKGWSKYFKFTHVNLCPEQDYTLIMPMAGKGDRFVRDGYDVPKPFLPINGLPMFFRAVMCLPPARENIFISRLEHTPFIDRLFFPFPKSWLLYVPYVTDGQAATCALAIQDLDPEQPILISACDNAAVYDQQVFLDLIADESNDVIVWSFKDHQSSRNNPDMYSWLDVDEDNRIRQVHCKQFVPGLSQAIIGTIYFRKAKYFLDGFKFNQLHDIRTNGEFYVDDVLKHNINIGLTVKAFPVENYICWGTPNDYKTYNYWKKYFSS